MASKAPRVSNRVRKLRKSCSTNHVRYRSKQEAVSHIHQIVGTHPSHTIPVRAFQCGYCNGWHLTSQPLTFPQPRCETGFVDGEGI
jgi:hypothetical protein